MKTKRVVGAGGIVGLAGLMLMPISTAHAATQNWQGTARSSALTVSLNPDAVFGVNAATQQLYTLLQPVLAQLGSGTNGLGSIKVSLDSSNALGTLNTALTDLTSGHSDSQALSIDIALLNGIAAKLADTLKPVTSALGTAGAAASPLVAAVTAANPTLGNTLSTVLANVGDPTKLLQALGINVNALTQANFHNAPEADVPTNTVNLVDIKGLPSALNLSLAPFHANAVPAALAGPNKLNGAQASADNTTTALDIVPTLAALGLPDLNGLLSGLTSLNLQSTITSVLGVVTQPGGATPTAVTSLLAGTPLAGLTSTLTQTVAPVTGAIQPVVGAAPLQALQTQLQALTGGLDLLAKLQGLIGNGLSLGDLVKTSGVTSTAILHPNNSLVESIATTKLASVDVLPLTSGLTAPLTSILNTVGAGNLSLLHIEGVAASAQTTLSSVGNTTAFNDATSSLSKISVLGRTLVGDGGLLTVDQLLQGLQKPLDVNIPGVADLQVIITRGLGTKLDSPTDRKATISALDVQINVGQGGALGLIPNTAAGGLTSNALTPGTSLLHAQLGSVLSEVTVTPDVAVVAPPTTQTSVPTNPTTGLFGPAALVGGAGLAGVAILMQVMPKLAARRRHDA